MSRARWVLVAVVVPGIVVLGGCATGVLGTGESEAATPSDEPTSLAEWVEPHGIAPALVRVTEIEGFVLEAQGVGVVADDGFSAMYSRTGGSAGDLELVTLRTSRGADPSAVPCTELTGTAEDLLSCTAQHDGVHVLLEGESVEPGILREAAEALREPEQGELKALFAELPEIHEPVERGDLPPHGEGAPMNEPGLGG